MQCQSTGEFKKVRLEETQVINLLINQAKCSCGNLDFFYDVTNVPRTDKLNFDRYYITSEILREDLELNKTNKPGDFDIIIIPAFKRRVFYEFTSAFEVKIVRPTNKNYRKNSNSLGTTQTLGIIKDGFPLVGLIHVCMNEPIDEKYIQHLPNLNDLNEIFTFDPFPMFSIENQYERILKTELPKYVGINVFGLSFNQKDQLIYQESSKFMNFKRGYFNPNVKRSTIEKIKNHYQNNKDIYIEKRNDEKTTKR